MKELCFWSVGDGKFAAMLQGLVTSFRQAGMQDDFIVFSDRAIEGAETILTGDFDKKAYLFKFEFLRRLAAREYRYFVFLDADTLFVRHAPSLWPLVLDSPVHAFFECDCTYPAKRRTWWGCPLEEYVRMMRDCGVIDPHVYNVNGGFFMVDRRAIEMVCSLVGDFWSYALSQGYLFTEEAPLAYAVHILCKQPEAHLLTRHFAIWATDWRAQFANRLPHGEAWVFEDWMRGDEFLINPAIVHLPKSKDLLVQQHH